MRRISTGIAAPWSPRYWERAAVRCRRRVIGSRGGCEGVARVSFEEGVGLGVGTVEDVIGERWM